MVIRAGMAAEKMEFRINILLYHIRRNGPIRRLELGLNLHRNKSHLCEVIQEMLDERLILEETIVSDHRGRKPIPLLLYPTEPAG